MLTSFLSYLHRCHLSTPIFHPKHIPPISICWRGCSAPKPPLSKGRCPEGVVLRAANQKSMIAGGNHTSLISEGFAVIGYEFALDLGESVLPAAESPSQKSVPRNRGLTAPFRQGGLWAHRKHLVKSKFDRILYLCYTDKNHTWRYFYELSGDRPSPAVLPQL